ncbi:MAG: tRNA lysidine(34) synthetase TilS [Bacteroidota bacterium]|nr:tRNA lysidine(34) synthetase TilS [Bacteroidota bacterium]
MLKNFQDFINDKELFESNETILLAVSGGIDSVVMLDLMNSAGYSFAIGHCNFNLRSKESDGDEELVSSLAEKYDAAFHNISFGTKEYANENGISIQMAARELRLKWFEEIRQTNGYGKIALAHHRNDEIETFFINLSRGTGIRGLTGMKAKNHHIIRPLLFAGRKEIGDYCENHDLSYREDSSNAKQEYYRNKIRHSIVPVFRDLNPRFSLNMSENIERLRQVEQIFHQAITEAYERCTTRKNNEVYFSISELKKLDPLSTYLFEFIREFNFTNSDLPEIMTSLDGSSGKMFYSPTHRILKDREHLIITILGANDRHNYYIDRGTEEIDKPLHLCFELVKKTEFGEINKSPAYAYLDYDKLNFPLILRRWKNGEYFMPFGMEHLKKLSDFFIDQKMSIIEKEKIWILASNEHPVWITGRRIDNRYKIDEKTENILIVKNVEMLRN